VVQKWVRLKKRRHCLTADFATLNVGYSTGSAKSKLVEGATRNAGNNIKMFKQMQEMYRVRLNEEDAVFLGAIFCWTG